MKSFSSCPYTVWNDAVATHIVLLQLISRWRPVHLVSGRLPTAAHGGGGEMSRIISQDSRARCDASAQASRATAHGRGSFHVCRAFGASGPREISCTTQRQHGRSPAAYTAPGLLPEKNTACHTPSRASCAGARAGFSRSRSTTASWTCSALTPEGMKAGKAAAGTVMAVIRGRMVRRCKRQWAWFDGWCVCWRPLGLLPGGLTAGGEGERHPRAGVPAEQGEELLLKGPGLHGRRRASRLGARRDLLLPGRDAHERGGRLTGEEERVLAERVAKLLNCGSVRAGRRLLPLELCAGMHLREPGREVRARSDGLARRGGYNCYISYLVTWAKTLVLWARSPACWYGVRSEGVGLVFGLRGRHRCPAENYPAQKSIHRAPDAAGEPRRAQLPAAVSRSVDAGGIPCPWSPGCQSYCAGDLFREARFLGSAISAGLGSAGGLARLTR